MRWCIGNKLVGNVMFLREARLFNSAVVLPCSESICWAKFLTSAWLPLVCAIWLLRVSNRSELAAIIGKLAVSVAVAAASASAAFEFISLATPVSPARVADCGSLVVTVSAVASVVVSVEVELHAPRPQIRAPAAMNGTNLFFIILEL